MNYLVKREHYYEYVKEHGTNKLDRYNRIWTPEKSFILSNFGESELTTEIFENGYETDYTIDEEDGNYKFIFKTNSGEEYRLDLRKDVDCYHIAFSLSKNELTSVDSYEKLTDRKESLEVLNRIIFILKNIDFDTEYCIGATGDDSKDKIYEYMLKNVSKWEKRDTDRYPNGWGLYFTI
jgi:hypothetical protein